MVSPSAIVIQCRFDYAVSLVFDDDIVVRIETPFEIRRHDSRHPIDPTNVGSMAEQIIQLLGAVAHSCRVLASGVLHIQFIDLRELVIEPNEQFEAWSMVHRDGSYSVALPGGGTSSFGRNE